MINSMNPKSIILVVKQRKFLVGHEVSPLPMNWHWIISIFCF